MNTIDLGFKREAYGLTAPVSAEEKPKTEVYYPSLSIQDKPGVAKALNVGDEVTAVVKFKVVEIMAREGGSQPYGPGDGCRVELEARSITFSDVKVDDEPEEESASAALKKFLSKKAEKKGGYDE